jgi:hypothetical protein
LLIK